MNKPLNLVGQRFGRLVVISRNPDNTSAGKSRWDCMCDCGTGVTVIGSGLTNGDTSSCGCWHDEVTATRSTTHGEASRTNKAPEYLSWQMMKSRCNNPNFHKYANYGALGVKVCDRWEEFENFLADMGPRPPGTSIDRIDPYGNYTPDNCRWATPKEQANNKRRHHA